MSDNKIQYFELETHETKNIADNHTNGSLTVVWRDWDKILQSEPKMVYISSVNPGEIKGPHLHTKRDSYFVCIRGKVIFIAKDENGGYIEVESNEKKPVMIHIPKNFASAHINPTNELSSVLVLASIAWRPNDNEMKNVEFEDYDWKKWNI